MALTTGTKARQTAGRNTARDALRAHALAERLVHDLKYARADVRELAVEKLLDEDLRRREPETVRAFFALIKELP